MKPFFAGLILICLSTGGMAYAATPVGMVPAVAKSNLTVELTDFVRVPASDSGRPLARINFLFHAGDGSGRLFVNDMRGKIYIVSDGVLLPTPFLDVAAARTPYFFAEDEEHGLVSFAFHPDFVRRGTPGFGKFYTIHSERGGLEGNAQTPLFQGPKPTPDHYEILTEWTVDPRNPNRIDPASRREILRLAPPYDDHGGGHLGFDPGLTPRDPDYGLLYISVGDGGNTVREGGGVDDFRQAQNMKTPYGKILRINPLQSGARRYTIPGSNPFAKQNGTLPEIWANGLRNPEHFSWDRGGNRKMLIADIGQANIEEIDLGSAGANYGWSIYEGDLVVDHQNEKKLTPLSGPAPKGFTFPVAEYGHGDGVAVTGGFVYRGKALPGLVGKYVFGDIVSGDIYYADAAALEAGARTGVFRLRLFYHGHETRLVKGVLSQDDRADLRFGQGEDGELYVLTKRDGMIRKMTPHKD